MDESITSEAQQLASDNIERTVSGLRSGVASATAGAEQAQATVRDGVQTAMRTVEDMVSFAQGNMEALTRSSQILVTGVQDLGQTVAATARASMDETVGAMKAMAAVKSFKDALDLQAGLFRSMLERAVSQTSQLTDSSLKLSEQAFAPIGARLSLAAQKFGRSA